MSEIFDSLNSEFRGNARNSHLPGGHVTEQWES
jgi:hypothetical protein